MKKVITLVLTLCLLASVISVCFTTTVSAANMTDVSFGIHSGTGAADSNIVADPAVEGGKAFYVSAGGTRPNLKLTWTGSKYAITLTTGTTYTVKFDYYLTAFNNGDFSLYYGASATASGQRAAVTNVTSSGFSGAFVGDGKWHTAAYTFTANVPTGGGVTLENLFLTYMNLTGYIKNIVVVTEGTDAGAYSTTVSTGNPNGYNFINRPSGAFNNYGGSTSAYSSVTTADGDLVIVAGSDTNKAPTHKNSVGWYSNYTPVVWCNNSTSTVQDIAANTTYIVTVRYKVSDNTGTATVGIGTCNANDKTTLAPVTGSGSHQAYCWNLETVTGNTDDWQTISARINVQAATYLKLLIAGPSGAKFTIDTYDITTVNVTLANAATVYYNDNGVESMKAVYAGTSHTVFGQDTEKEFLGWYSDPEFTTPSTVAVDGETVYARYVGDATAYELVNQGSIRAEDANATPYVSAGLRFKGRVTEDFRASATEIGFYAVPTAALNGASVADYLAADGSMAISTKVKADDLEEEIVYEVSTDNYGTKFYDYQLIITGLTRKGETASLLGTEITCVMYMITNGQTVYSNAISYSYNQVAGIQ